MNTGLIERYKGLKTYVKKVHVLAVVILPCICLISCNKLSHKVSQVREGWCAVDGNNKIHIDKNCPYIYDSICATCPIEQFFRRVNNIDDIWNCVCRKCISPAKYLNIYNQMKEYEEVYIRDRRDEYDALCFIGENKWDNFEDYYVYIKDKENRRRFEKELEQKGYVYGYGLECISLDMIAYHLYDENITSSDIEWELNDWNVKELFVEMRKSGIETGTYKEFVHGLENEDVFLWYYKKSKQLRIVQSLKDFVMMVYKPPYDLCKECWDEELSEEYYDEREEY